jgi:hypothetical protein
MNNNDEELSAAPLGYISIAVRLIYPLTVEKNIRWPDVKVKNIYLYSGRMHPVACVTMNRNNEPPLTTAFKRALLPRIIHYMFRLQFKPSSGVSNQNTESGHNGSVVNNCIEQTADTDGASTKPTSTKHR